MKLLHKIFNNQKVVFKYPIDNDACFIFISSYELLGLLRKATKEEELFGKRMEKFKNIEDYWLDDFRIDK
ncbi:hypothetical protein JZM32_01320 [Acinetobacter pittii]|uniref:hypothetical protein n=1 Tax=Acinetobacter pittii TaxID=48296 RepID=UPI00192AB9E2|nr:hypothetical protein [Acinetobacter pittii]MBN6526631.1 hypothetical protein [Acinetobacter pittii]